MTESVTPTTEPRPNLRQLAKQRTSDKVLQAARSLFETEGYEGATIRGIAKAAGMSTGAVFANYVDKSELYLAAYGHRPISPEIGRAALKALRALTVDLGGDSDLIDMVGAYAHVAGHAMDVLELAKFPDLPEGQPNPDDTALVDVMQWALEVRT